MSRLGQLTKVESHQQILELVSDYSLPDNQYFFDRFVFDCKVEKDSFVTI